jgi:hypothetical protein
VSPVSRRPWLAWVAVLPLLLAASLGAQTGADRSPVIGVGITVPDFGVLLPINVSPHFRLEPYVMFVSERADYPASSDTAWASHTRVGLGVFSVTHPGETMRVYFGSRLGLLWGSTRVDGPTVGQASSSGNGWFAGGAIGGEYSPVPRMAVGGEALIEYEHTSPSAGTALTTPGTTFARAWFSSGSLVVRFYP